MASGQGIIGGLLGRLFFREATVERVREVSPHFRWVEWVGDGLRDVAWSPGDKVQVYLPGEGMRTYTPLGWDAALGATRFLVYLHGDGPGAAWGRAIKPGDRCQFFGPRGSIDLKSLRGPVVLFGDETSFAVAHTLRNLRASTADVEYVFEVSARAESESVLTELGLAGATVVERQAADAHAKEVASRVRATLERRPGAQLVLTGRARSIQALRATLRDSGAPHAGQKVKAYWADGKRGLD
ncbi:siderophore-interacting protein [Myxococcus fulvus]|uniref:siderophore-interacting protein n=1 Tax=Myxococcus fulvus TaxID=33 RepID=UPI003B98EDC1